MTDFGWGYHATLLIVHYVFPLKQNVYVASEKIAVALKLCLPNHQQQPCRLQNQTCFLIDSLTVNDFKYVFSHPTWLVMAANISRRFTQLTMFSRRNIMFILQVRRWHWHLSYVCMRYFPWEKHKIYPNKYAEGFALLYNAVPLKRGQFYRQSSQ